MENYTDVRATQKSIFVEHSRNTNPKSMAKCHYHPYYEIYYLSAGERFYYIKDKMYRLKKGNLIIIPPNVLHSTLSKEGSMFERFLVAFSKEAITDVADAFKEINFYESFENDIYILSFSPDEQLIIQAILQNMNNTSNDVKRKFLLSQLLYHINSSSPSDEMSEKYLSDAHKNMTEIAAYINNNYNQELSLQSLATRFFIDPYYLSRVFKKSLGISFVDYINSVRVMEAKKLLQDTDKSIITIAQEVSRIVAMSFCGPRSCTKGLSS